MQYIGNELELFSYATNWKSRLAKEMSAWIMGDVLEVGAGTGVNIPYLCNKTTTTWTALEPDPDLCEAFRKRQAENDDLRDCEIQQGTIENLRKDREFDTILYIDVLEHIKDDVNEFNNAYSRLKKNGHLIILCPAHNFLYSPFDSAIGHYRRYNKTMYRGLSCHEPLTLKYLDAAGLLASLVNRFALRASTPSKAQINFWDKKLIPASNVLDKCLYGGIGKSLLGVWQKN